MAFLAFVLALLGSAFAGDATGILKVKTSATGAEVYLDGALIGPAPVLKYVPVGSHKLRVVADNFEPFVRNITVEADKTVEVQAALNPGPGSVEFTGPAGATLVFDKQTYSLPVRIPFPGKGAHTWSATAPGFEETTSTVEVVAGKNYLFDVVLESSAGVLAVTTTPIGAKVFVDGAEVGVTPLRQRGLTQEVHGVLIQADGYATEVRAVDMSGGKRGELDLKLDKGGATVTVETGDAAATVYLDAAPVGTGEKVQVDHLAGGKVEVVVKVADQTIRGSFRVPDNGRLDLRRSGSEIVTRKPLTQRWGFWAAVGGGAVAAGAGAVVVASVTAPPTPATGDTVVTLP